MAVSQTIVVSPGGSGTTVLAEVMTALGYTAYGTMSGLDRADGGGPGPGEVHAVLTAAYGADRAALLLGGERDGRSGLESAFQDAVSALWRVWWTRLGQPVTHASPVDPVIEGRLTRVPDTELPRLLPGSGCWYVTGLDLQRADAGFLRVWQRTGLPPVVYHHRDVRDRIISQILHLSRPGDHVGTLPEHLIYRDILGALPSLEARITLALTDPGFPGTAEARRSQWLLHHPAVCVIAHEELVGPAHGGTHEARERALTRLLDTTGHPVLPPLPAAPSNGDGDGDLTVGLWRGHFTADHERLLDRYHSDLMTVGGA
ncbi:hypothetical protein [Streptomyces sp. NPDC020965]|uniref:hypothetical protein n=1 Tax=Streptomyces sp. NPDC020965 TaxID=3365105 RepID=UPI0037ABF996